MKRDDDVKRVLTDDGLDPDSLDVFHKYENFITVSLDSLRKDLGMGAWAVRVAYNDRFGGVIIQQQPGEGNRKHYHPDADENWVIMDGEWEWWIEGSGTTSVKTGEIVVVPKGVWHHIKCVGTSPGVRYAITAPDVNHVYED
jgi:quercetin dioxygenase-like cupin family protein